MGYPCRSCTGEVLYAELLEHATVPKRIGKLVGWLELQGWVPMADGKGLYRACSACRLDAIGTRASRRASGIYS